MLPLGDAWSGFCHAVPDSPWQPGSETLYPLCNLGYARGRCPRFPAGDAPDAVRFTIRADLGSSLQLYFVLERDHLPVAHGPLEFVPSHAAPGDAAASGAFRPAPDHPAVARLARAYVDSYFRRKAEAVPR